MTTHHEHIHVLILRLYPECFRAHQNVYLMPSTGGLFVFHCPPQWYYVVNTQLPTEVGREGRYLVIDDQLFLPRLSRLCAPFTCEGQCDM
jgi:hypothetical protein